MPSPSNPPKPGRGKPGRKTAPRKAADKTAPPLELHIFGYGKGESIDKTAPPLELHIFGYGKGESIVLRLPDGQWVVVDCYAQDLDKPDHNPVVQFLRERQVSELLFVCVTHPHDDHYRGMSHLLDPARFTVGAFWRFCITPFPEVAGRVKQDWSQLVKDEPEEEEVVQSIQDLQLTLLRAAQINREREWQFVRRGRLGDVVCRIPRAGSRAAVRVRVVAPSSRFCERYTTAVEAGRAENLRHNDVSLALLVKYGDQQVLLGGDVEHEHWTAVRAEVTESGSAPPARSRCATTGRRTGATRNCGAGCFRPDAGRPGKPSSHRTPGSAIQARKGFG